MSFNFPGAYLKAKYPILFENLNCGIEVGDSCLPIIEKLSGDITEYEIGRDLVDFQYARTRIVQIKEKFWEGRIYYRGGDKKVDDMILQAESDITMELEKMRKHLDEN